MDLSQLKFWAQRLKLKIEFLAKPRLTTSWVWSRLERLFCYIPQHSLMGRYLATKQAVIHFAFIAFVGFVAWQGHLLIGLDNTSLLYAYVAGDEVGSGPLDPSAYAQTDAVGTGGPRLAGVEASDGNFITFDNPEVNFAQTLTGGSAVVAPSNPNQDPLLPADQQPKSEPAPEPTIYTIKDGDTIAGIAQDFGVSVSTVLWANGLTNADTIKVGDHLTILPVSGVLYMIKSGDTVLALANKYNAEAKEIIAYNKLDGDGGLRIGEKIIIPGGEKADTAPAPSILPRTASRLAQAEQAPAANDDTPPPASSPEKSSGFIWPTTSRHISQYFQGAHRGHTGIDIDNRSRPPVFAAQKGVVEFAGWLGGYGNLIIVNHGNGITTYYAHLEKFYVSKGDNVKQGESLAKMGSTGHSTGPHVHFEVRRNGVPINPLGMY